MHTIYFGCPATDLLDFYKDTSLQCYGNLVSEWYPTKCIVFSADSY